MSYTAATLMSKHFICCQYLLIVHSWLSLRFSLTCIYIDVNIFYMSKLSLRFSLTCIYIDVNIFQLRDTGNIGHTRHMEKTIQKTEKWAKRDPQRSREWTHALAKGLQFLLLIRHPLFMIIFSNFKCLLNKICHIQQQHWSNNSEEKIYA
jgi:hypothetical protein